MFAVEGWKLGDVVAQTNIKKKLKRKREEVQETTGTKDEGKGKGPRINPFALGNAQPTKVSAGQQKKTAEAEASKTVKEDAVPAAPTISKRQQARNRAEKRAQRKLDNASNAEDHLPVEKTISKPIPRELPSAVPIPALTPLQQKMRAKLSGSQFRQINEKLYTTHSSEALSLFTEQPSLFHDYHQGFRHQVQSWPTNPIQVFISLLSSLRKNTNHKSPLLIADLGCGDAALANHFQNTKGIKIRSFDLVKVNDFIEVCDMANVPLKDESVDVAVFCLSLMGTNFLNFIAEACRYTKLNGQIWIAEIKSRFVDSSFQSFVERLKEMGLKLVEMDKENKMFVIMRFEKISRDGWEESGGGGGGLDEGKLLKACLYKKR